MNLNSISTCNRICSDVKSEEKRTKVRKSEEMCGKVRKCEEMRGEHLSPGETVPYIYNEDEKIKEDEDMKKIRQWALVAAVAIGVPFFHNMDNVSKQVKTDIKSFLGSLFSSEVKVRLDLTFTNLTKEGIRMKAPEIVLRHGEEIVAVSKGASCIHRISKGATQKIEPIYLTIALADLAKIDPEGVKKYRRTDKWQEGRIKLEAEVRSVVDDLIPYHSTTEITI